MKQINITEYIRKEGDILLDVRSTALYHLGHMEGAINIPLEDISSLYELPKDRDIYVYCQRDDYSAEVAQLLFDAGYNVTDLIGGYDEYIRKILGG